ncbi:MAG: T9SS type A sorting domain-containing protein [Candidatus Cloacimonetes bacterium]|nr:T9SS type A sorting domain-containing protein [Candidatus Cloacimonadota bacterium]
MQEQYTMCLEGIVDNDEEISLYANTPPVPDPSLSDIDMVIIGEAQFADDFEEYMLWKTFKGLHIIYKPVEEIDTEYAGDLISTDLLDDRAGKIRAYLHDKWNNMGLTYALIVGGERDADNLPDSNDDLLLTRYTTLKFRHGEDNQTVWGTFNDRIACDLYFADYNGDYSTDGDEWYGERGSTVGDDALNNIDKYREIALGRILISDLGSQTPEEKIRNWTQKVITYEYNPGFGDTEYLNHGYSVNGYFDQELSEEEVPLMVLRDVAFFYTLSTLLPCYSILTADRDTGIPNGNQVVRTFANGMNYSLFGLHGAKYVQVLCNEAVCYHTNAPPGVNPWYWSGYFVKADDSYLCYPQLTQEIGNGMNNLTPNGKIGITFHLSCLVGSYQRYHSSLGGRLSMAEALSTAWNDRGSVSVMASSGYVWDHLGNNNLQTALDFPLQRFYSTEQSSLINRISFGFTFNNYISHLPIPINSDWGIMGNITGLQIFGDPEVIAYVGEPEIIEVTHNFSEHSITATVDSQPIEGAFVHFLDGNYNSIDKESTDEYGVASCGFEFSYVCVTAPDYIPYLARLAVSNETINSEEDIFCDFIVPPDVNLYVNSFLNFKALGRKSANLIVSEGANLYLNGGIIAHRADYNGSHLNPIQIDIPGNKVIIYGNLIDNGEFIISGPENWKGVEFIGSSFAVDGGIVFNTKVIIENGDAMINDVIFNNCSISIDTGSFDAQDCDFNHSNFLGFGGSGAEIVNIVNCTFNSEGLEAIHIDSYRGFSIRNNHLSNCCVGFYSSNSGQSFATINNNIFENISCVAIHLSNSYGKLREGNVISNCGYGISACNYSKWCFVGSGPSHQQISNPISMGVMFTTNSYTTRSEITNNYFSLENPEESSMFVCQGGQPRFPIDLRNNDWGDNFDADLFLQPTSDWYEYMPMLGDRCDDDSPTITDSLYSATVVAMENQDYITANQLLWQLVNNYPDCNYVTNSLKLLFSIAYIEDEDFGVLKNQMQQIAAIDSTISEAIEFHSIQCDIVLGNYQQALLHFESIVANTPTVADSVNAALQIARIQMLAERDDNYNQRLLSNYPELCIKSTEEYHELHSKLAYLLLDEENYKIRKSDDVPANVNITLRNYPNPFNPETIIEFSLPEADHVKLTVYNIKGQKVKTLFDDNAEKGLHKLIWDGKNSTGKCASSGVYFYRLVTSKRTVTQKMALIK